MGRKQQTTFGEVLRRVFSGDDTLYMTTQEAPMGPDGHPEVLAPPAAQLASDFPLQPALLGSLVPQQVNIWMGCAPEGSTTGLHHDLHDNLYVLIHGKKRFRLFPPSEVGNLYVHGTPVKVHPNGRIVYEGSGDVLADGSDAKEVAAWRAKREAHEELAAAEAAVQRGEAGAAARLAAAERALDDVLEAALQDAFDDDEAMFDDFEAMERAAAGSRGGPAGNGDSESDLDPPSFSKIDMSLPPAALRSRFPLFPGVEAALECEVRAGQALYLPAGWFHEVTSYSGSPDMPGSTAAHLALNYWVHPPDVTDPSREGFRRPYISDYWPAVWETRRVRYGSAAAATSGVGGNKRKVEGSGAHEYGMEGIKEKRHKRGDVGHDHHHHGCGCGGEPGDGESDGELSDGERAHFLRGIRGMFGYGRRQHLYRFVGVRLKR